MNINFVLALTDYPLQSTTIAYAVYDPQNVCLAETTMTCDSDDMGGRVDLHVGDAGVSLTLPTCTNDSDAVCNTNDGLDQDITFAVYKDDVLVFSELTYLDVDYTVAFDENLLQFTFD